MVSHFSQELQNPIFDALYCEEERFYEDLADGFILSNEDFNEIHKNPFPILFEHDLFWEDDELVSLFSKEKKQTHSSYEMNSDGSLKTVRNEAVKWMLKVTAHYGFTAMTGVLAVNYYDRFVTSLCFQEDKPWMSQLVAVACVSVAAKMEETQVPLLLDFQVEESKYFFEAKTIQKMELLVLSTLQWKMNPVTPISYFDHIVRRLGLVTNVHCEFLGMCENLILSIITDSRIVHYLPSVIAAATMIRVFREIEPCDSFDYQNQILSVLRTSKEEIDECHNLIMEITNDGNRSNLKRRHESFPSSPNGVFDAYFSSDSSNDSWAVSSSPEPLFKRSRAQDRHMFWSG